jgi:hypothetical protein
LRAPGGKGRRVDDPDLDDDAVAMARLERARDSLLRRLSRMKITDAEAHLANQTDVGCVDDELKVARILLLRALNGKAFDQYDVLTLDVQERLLERITALRLTRALLDGALDSAGAARLASALGRVRRSDKRS